MIKQLLKFASYSLVLSSAYLALAGNGCDDLHRMAPKNELHLAASNNDLDGIERE